MSIKYKWWEKTVEYSFILSLYDSINFAAPLAGLEENGGDAMFAQGSKLVLVEFKRNKECVASELEKFKTYNEASAVLKKVDGHHFIVYGHGVSTVAKKTILVLEAHTYFSRNPVSAKDIFSRGIEKSPFDEYLAVFLKHKLKDGRSSGAVTPASYGSVFGLASNGQVQSTSVVDYLEQQMNPGLTLGPEEPTIASGPRF